MIENEIKESDFIPEKDKKLELLKKEKANYFAALNLLTLLKNTKSKGTNFQKEILKKVFNK